MKKSKIKKYKTNKILFGQCAGLGIGSVLGLILQNVTYMSIGMGIGVIIDAICAKCEKIKK